MDQAVKKKRQMWKEWKQGGSNEPYLQAKRDSKRAVYAAKKSAEEETSSNIIGKENSRKEVFKIAKQMKAANCDLVGDKCIKNDKGELVFTDAEKHLAWKEHYERLPNEEFPWDQESLVLQDPVFGPQPQIDRESVKSALAKMKKGKAPGTSGVVTEMLLTSGDAGLDMMTSLFNCILKEKRIPTEWDTRIIANNFKLKGEATERDNYRRLKLLEHMMKIFEIITEEEICKVIDISDMQFEFMSRKGTIDAIFIATQLQEKYLEKKKHLYFAFVDLEKALDRVPRQL